MIKSTKSTRSTSKSTKILALTGPLDVDGSNYPFPEFHWKSRISNKILAPNLKFGFVVVALVIGPEN